MEISNSFIASEEELTLEAKPDSLSAKNYIEGARVNDKFMRSQLKLKPSEFVHYKVEQDTVITFCIKEFRAFLLFAEALNAEMTLEFDDAGTPFFVKIKKHSEIECLLILSTLSPDDVSFSEDYRQREISQCDLIQRKSVKVVRLDQMYSRNDVWLRILHYQTRTRLFFSFEIISLHAHPKLYLCNHHVF